MNSRFKQIVIPQLRKLQVEGCYVLMVSFLAGGGYQHARLERLLRRRHVDTLDLSPTYSYCTQCLRYSVLSLRFTTSKEPLCFNCITRWHCASIAERRAAA